MDVQECLAEVKRCMGKDAYKSVFLPLLRVYRQDQDVPKLSTGLRKIAVPLLPAPRLLSALATLLPTAVQQSFLHQLNAESSTPKPQTEQSVQLLNARHGKRTRTDSDPAAGDSSASQHSTLLAAGPITPKLEQMCSALPLLDSKPTQTMQTNKEHAHHSQPMQFSAKAESPTDGAQPNISATAATGAAQFRGNVKRIKDAEAFQKQKERRQKKAAFLLDGTTTGPVVGVAQGSSWGQSAQQHAVRIPGGHLVQLPVRPNRSQILLMQSITAALQQKRHALLESPTGTGKTLALLCASLSWQQQQVQKAKHTPDVAAPRIFWAARTHAQIDHAVHEVRRTGYRPMMTILASRERFCLHPDIAVAPNKTEACEGATMVGHMDCSYLENAEASWYPQGPEHLPAYKPGGRLETFDIEELVAEGKAGHVCPYHASRDILNEGAALVFVTYSQLLDPPVRSANGLDDLLKGAVLVFDEAHNIAAECRAAATLQMSTADLEALALDLGGMQGSLNKMAPASRQWRQAADWARELAQLVDTMQAWLAHQLSSCLPFQKEQGMANSRAAVEVWEGSGSDAHHAVVHHLDLSIHRVETLQGRLKAMRRGLIEGGFESTAVKSGAINQLEGLLSKLLFVLQTRGLGYRCILSRQSTAGKAMRGPAQPSATPGVKAAAAAAVEGSFSFLCLHAAVALTPLLPNAHSLLLTSGTLSPVAPLVAELGLGKTPKRQAHLPNSLGFATSPGSKAAHVPKQQHLGFAQNGVQPEVPAQTSVQCSPVQSVTRAELILQAPVAANAKAQELGTVSQVQCSSKDLPADQQTDQPQTIVGDHQAKAEQQAETQHQHQQQQEQQEQQQQGVRSQHARLHQGVELVSAPHHHTLPARLLPLTISMAPGLDGRLVKLDSAFERRQDTGYLDALGSAMLTLCQGVPNGVLCFFPSWGLLNAARDQWLVTGMYQHLCACKEITAEPSNVSGEVFDEAIKGYRQAAAQKPGAVLLAVMRGRSSEGVDFLDDCARAVVVVGIPYPPLYETSVHLKRSFNQDHEALLGSGDDWYAAEAFRAVNQAIGRLIRHQKDYGAVILLDHRYNVLKFRQMTPAWLQPLLKSTAMADASRLLHDFFSRQK